MFKAHVLSNYVIAEEAPKNNTIKVYHASHEDIKELRPRPVTSFDKLGTWFDEDPKMARLLYGPKVFEFEIPAGDYLEVTESTNEFLLDEELQERHWDAKELRRFRQLAREGDAAHQRGQEETVRSKIQAMQRIFSQQVYRNPEYLKAFRAQIEHSGWDGIKFVDSTIDTNPSERHTVYCLFNHAPLKPTKQVE